MTYFYYRNPEVPRLEIGCDSPGWAFALVVDNVPGLEAWKKAWEIPGSVIKDSSGKTISPDEMEMIITFRDGNNLCHRRIHSCHFIGSHNLIHQIIGTRTWGYECLANKDCYDICLKYEDD